MEGKHRSIPFRKAYKLPRFAPVPIVIVSTVPFFFLVAPCLLNMLLRDIVKAQRTLTVMLKTHCSTENLTYSHMLFLLVYNTD